MSRRLWIQASAGGRMTTGRAPKPGECWRMKALPEAHARVTRVPDAKSNDVKFRWRDKGGGGLSLRDFTRNFEPCAEHAPEGTGGAS